MSFYTIVAKAQQREADILIYASIGTSYWEETIEASQFVNEIDALDVDVINVRINSDGGSVKDGLAIYNAIKRHKAKVNTFNDGQAASIASYILQAGDNRYSASNAITMVHAPWGGLVGNANAMREYADILDLYSTAVSEGYVNEKMTKEDVMASLLDGEDHFMSADEALAMGLIDEIQEPLALAASLDKGSIVQRFKGMDLEGNFISAVGVGEFKEKTMADNVGTDTEVKQDDSTEGAKASMGVNKPVYEDVKAEVLAKEKQRKDDIAALATGTLASNQAVMAVISNAKDDMNVTVEAAREQVLAALAKGTEPVAGTYIQVESNEKEIKGAMVNAVLIRAGLADNDASNPFRGQTLYEMAKASLDKANVQTSHMDRMGIVAAAFTHSTSDFTHLLADVANKSMLKGYDEAEEVFNRFTSVGVLSDFKPTKRVDLNTFPSLKEVPEGAEYTYATLGDRGETTQLATYGRMFSITRQAIINDDLQGFTKIPRRMGRAAVRTVGDLVFAVLTGNQTMSDGNGLFHASHNNILTESAINTASIDKMLVKFGLQKEGEATLNIPMQYLLVPLALRGTALTVANSEFEVGASAKNNTTPNSVRGAFEVIADARLDAASATTWYGVSNPNTFDTIEVSYLDGNPQPTLEQEAGWTVDGVDMKVRLDAGVKALDYRTFARNVPA